MEAIKYVEGREDLVRTMDSKAIINTDEGAFEARKRQKEFAELAIKEKQNDKERISLLEEKVEKLIKLMESK